MVWSPREISVADVLAYFITCSENADMYCDVVAFSEILTISTPFVQGINMKKIRKYVAVSCSVRFTGEGDWQGLTPPLDEDNLPSAGLKFWSGEVGFSVQSH